MIVCFKYEDEKLLNFSFWLEKNLPTWYKFGVSFFNANTQYYGICS